MRSPQPNGSAAVSRPRVVGKRNALRIFATLGVCLLAAEAGLRAAGALDFPLYDVDEWIGYVVKPNQAGTFWHRHAWAFNDRSMATAATWNPAHGPNVLLIGNSIVMGGNPYDQSQRVGTLLQRQLAGRAAVWPIATGGWTNVNEAVYLERHPDVSAASDVFVWEVMAGGFSQLSTWRGEYTFPREKPPSATWYLVRRYLLPRLIPLATNELPPTGEPRLENVRRFESMVARLSRSADRGAPGILLIYPTQRDLLAARRGELWLPELGEVQRVAAAYGLRILDLSASPRWRPEYYRDGVHPTVEGNAVLAQLLAEQLLSLWNR